ncbi:MAG TPA: hypothetical protein VMV81_13150, partial [Phycisphaerae bacterium]|nr:hypothetical protein [Phycisphaerae bacterium]
APASMSAARSPSPGRGLFAPERSNFVAVIFSPHRFNRLSGGAGSVVSPAAADDYIDRRDVRMGLLDDSERHLQVYPIAAPAII